MSKIEQYLPAAFAALAFVMLLLIGSKDETPMESGPAGTEPTSQSSQAPSDADPVPEETLAKSALARVEQALDKYPLDETAMAFCVYDGGLHADDATTGAGRDAHANALARLCDEQRMNPVAAFWLLADQELYAYEGSQETISVPAFTLPLQARKEYSFTTEGTRELLTDILSLSGAVDDGMRLGEKLLGENGKVDKDQIFHEAGDCRYAYFVYYGERSAHFLCFYTRGGEKIEDVEFQLLNLRYADGDAERLARIDQTGDRQAASLMAAAEQLLTGSSRADEGRIESSYTVDGSSVTVERFAITGDGEKGTLTNYSIHIEG